MYQIVVCNTITELKQTVIKYMEQEWEPLGGMVSLGNGFAQTLYVPKKTEEMKDAEQDQISSVPDKRRGKRGRTTTA
jgi:hypothetical protein